jgi:hypothetical protein
MLLPMTDVLPLTELEPSAPGRERRAAPVLWIIVGLLLIGAVAAAVLLGGDDRSPAERLAAAPDAVDDAGTFAYEIGIQSTIGSVDNTVALTGEVDAKTKRSAAHFDIAGMALEMVSDGTTLYLRLPEEARAATGGKPWTKLDLNAIAPGLGALSGDPNPMQSFDQLRKAGTEVEEVGEEEVRGTETTHFRTVLDLTSSLDQLGGAALGDQAEPLRKQLAAVPVDVWLDGDDRIRRQRTTLDLSLPGVPGATGTKVTTTVEAFDYGKPVTIEVPEPEDVSDLGIPGLGGLFAPATPDAASSTD